jgi:ferrous iron transport protein B
MDPARHVAAVRNRAARDVAAQVQKTTTPGRTTVTERLDAVALHRFLGPALLVAVLLALYQGAIGLGDGLGEDLRGALTAVEDWVGLVLPAQGFLEDPLLRSLGIWTVQGVTAILGYLPVFLLLFGCIAVLEDSGYMPRMAFLLDRLFRRFGLHGQSTLPLILGGVYLGGCAIPAIMTTRGIPDERARLTTMLIAPMMNCLAKVPLHLILIGAYFADNQGLALFFISTVTLFMALPWPRPSHLPRPIRSHAPPSSWSCLRTTCPPCAPWPHALWSAACCS